METLPEALTLHKRTPDFKQDSVPAGILGHHTTAEGVWGKIKITEGSLTYRILESEIEEIVLDVNQDGVVAPQVPHQVEVIGPVTFYVEFYRQSA